MIQCLLDGKACQLLWDTGSMISMVDRDWLEQNCPDKEIHPITSFIEEGLKLVAANSTEILYEGVVLMELSMTKECASVTVPILVSNEKLSDPILGNNVI